MDNQEKLDKKDISEQSNRDSQALQGIVRRLQNVVGSAEVEIKYQGLLQQKDVAIQELQRRYDELLTTQRLERQEWESSLIKKIQKQLRGPIQEKVLLENQFETLLQQHKSLQVKHAKGTQESISLKTQVQGHLEETQQLREELNKAYQIIEKFNGGEFDQEKHVKENDQLRKNNKILNDEAGLQAEMIQQLQLKNQQLLDQLGGGEHLQQTLERLRKRDERISQENQILKSENINLISRASEYISPHKSASKLEAIRQEQNMIIQDLEAENQQLSEQLRVRTPKSGSKTLTRVHQLHQENTRLALRLKKEQTENQKLREQIDNLKAAEVQLQSQDTQIRLLTQSYVGLSNEINRLTQEKETFLNQDIEK